MNLLDTNNSNAARIPSNLEELDAPHIQLQVTRRDGEKVNFNYQKIMNRLDNCAKGLRFVDVKQVLSKTIDGLYEGVTTTELDSLLMQNTAMLIGEEPEYSKLAARLLARYIDEEAALNGVRRFSEGFQLGVEFGLLSPEIGEFVKLNAQELDRAVELEKNGSFRIFRFKNRIRSLPTQAP